MGSGVKGHQLSTCGFLIAENLIGHSNKDTGWGGGLSVCKDDPSFENICLGWGGGPSVCKDDPSFENIRLGWGGGLSVCKDDPSSAHTSSFVLTRPVPTTQWNHITCTKHLHS